MVHLHGGPGGGIMQQVALTTVFFEKLRARRDIIAFDQRGVDASGGLTRCFETLAENVEPIARQIGGEMLPGLEDELVAACLAELKDGGVDIRHINTAQNARDVRALVTALGYDDYNIYGISYGTKLGLEVMRSAPEGLRAVVLDSVAPPTAALYDELMLPYWESVERTFDTCAAQPKCAEAYPGGADAYWSLVAKLQDEPIDTADGPLTGEALFSLVSSRNSWNQGPRGLTAYLPLLVHELSNGETATADAIAAGQLPPVDTMETILAGAQGLSAADMLLARTALTTAEQIEQMHETVQRTLGVLEGDLAAARSRGRLAEEFDAELQSALEALPEKAQRVEFARDYLALRGKPPSSGALIGLVATHFDAATRDRLLSLAQLMEMADVVDTFDRIGGDNAGIEQVLMKDFELYLYACQEDMDNNSVEGVAAVHDRLDVAEVLENEFAEGLAAMYATCALFESHPRPGFHEPVESPIPTLVFGGELDTQTATSWAELTAATLENGRAIIMPETGHGALAFSDCALDLGVAFIDYPEAQLDTSCVQDLVPRFVLPDGTLSGG
ncbi:alpha/beta fold hydrolase [Halovulum sp. GXIMD14794]